MSEIAEKAEILNLYRDLQALATSGGYPLQLLPKTDSTWKNFALKCYSVFALSVFLLFTFISFVSLSFEKTLSLDLLFKIAVVGGTFTALNISYDFIFSRKVFEEAFVWIEEFCQNYPKNFENALKTSLSIVKWSKIYFVINFHVILLIECLYYLLFDEIWDENGEFKTFVLPFNFYLPWILHDTWFSFGLNWAFQVVGEGISLLIYSIFIAIVSSLVIMFEANYETIVGHVEILSEKIEFNSKNNMRDISYENDIKNVIKMHQNVTEFVFFSFFLKNFKYFSFFLKSIPKTS